MSESKAEEQLTKQEIQDIKFREFLEKNIRFSSQEQLHLLINTPCNISILSNKAEILMCNGSTLNLYANSDEVDFSASLFDNIVEIQPDGKAPQEKFSKCFKDAVLHGSNRETWQISKGHQTSYTFDICFNKISSKNPEHDFYIIAVTQDALRYINQSDSQQFINNRLSAIVSDAPYAMTLWDSKFNIIMSNNQMLKLLGVSDNDTYCKNFSKYSPEYQPNGLKSNEYALSLLKKAASGEEVRLNWMHMNSAGKDIPVEAVAKKIELDDDYIITVYVRDLSHDFLDTTMNTEALSEEETYFTNRVSARRVMSGIAQMANEWFFVYDRRTHQTQYYGNHPSNLGSEQGKLVNQDIPIRKGRVHPDDAQLHDQIRENLKNGICKTIDLRYLCPDSTYRYFRVETVPLKAADGDTVYMIGRGTDVNDELLTEQRSKVDLLTNCYNKITAEGLIAEKMLLDTTAPHTLFIIDIDDFKAVNDNLGHFFGDEVLREVSSSLKGQFRSRDIIGRIGGDEFIVFTEGLISKETIERKAQAIVGCFQKTYSGENKTYSISGSIGIATQLDKNSTYEDLYKAADKALYKAKLLGKNQYVFYDESMKLGTMKNLTKLDNAMTIANRFFDYDLISTIFNILYERNSDNTGINICLQYLCKKYNCDRAYIFETSDNGETYSNTFEWCAAGISPEIDNLQNVSNYEMSEFFTEARNGILYSNDLQETFTNKDSFKLMHDQGILSFLHAQTRKNGIVTFFIGLDDCTKKRVWSEHEINSVQYLGKIFSIMLQRSQMERQLSTIDGKSTISEYISQASGDIAYAINLDSCELSYLNDAALEFFGTKPIDEIKCNDIYDAIGVPTDVACANFMRSKTEFHEWSYRSEKLDRTFFFRNKLIEANGMSYRLEIATDITKIKSLEGELHEKLEDEKILVACIETLHSDNDASTSVGILLKTLGQFFDADRCHIFELDESGISMSNTHEWCNEGIDSQKGSFENVDATMLQPCISKAQSSAISTACISGEEVRIKPEFEILRYSKVDELLISLIMDQSAKVTGFIGLDNPRQNSHKQSILQSVTRFVANTIDEAKIVNELKKISLYDEQTGLKNRYSYNLALEEFSHQEINSLGIIFIDIQGLKAINEIQGLEKGDEALRNVSRLIGKRFATNAYRIGGDEFVVLLGGISESHFEEQAELLKLAISETNVPTSIGYSWNSNPDASSLSESRTYKEFLAYNLEQEIKRGSFVVYLQPQFNMKTKEIEGAEALIRRVKSNGEVQLPSTFLPFYETEGLVAIIDEFVLESVCKTMNEWETQGIGENLIISINCSRVTVAEDSIVSKFKRICDKYSVKPSRIMIEITETINGISKERLNEIISQFRKEGFCISLDDFGTGFSNLGSLISSDYDEIKLDMSISRDIAKDEKSLLVGKSLFELCKNLDGVTAVAEGIEHEAQFEILRKIDCEKGQGFWLGRPVPINNFVADYIEMND